MAPWPEPPSSRALPAALGRRRGEGHSEPPAVPALASECSCSCERRRGEARGRRSRLEPLAAWLVGSNLCSLPRLEV